MSDKMREALEEWLSTLFINRNDPGVNHSREDILKIPFKAGWKANELLRTDTYRVPDETTPDDAIVKSYSPRRPPELMTYRQYKATKQAAGFLGDVLYCAVIPTPPDDWKPE